MVLTVGKHSYGYNNINIRFPADRNLIIGSYCSIAKGCTVFLGGNHRIDWVTTFPFGYVHQEKFTNPNRAGHPSSNGDVIIGNDVWIGSNVTIMSGVTIGDGVVIAANSHVVKDVPPYSLTGGNPARHIKYRFTEPQIEQLLKIKWWEWADEQIQSVMTTLCSPNVDEFLTAANIIHSSDPEVVSMM